MISRNEMRTVFEELADELEENAVEEKALLFEAYVRLLELFEKEDSNELAF